MKARSHWALLGGIGVGATLMYLLDSESGRRRRAMARARTARALRRGGRGVKAAARKVSNRARGLAAQARSRVSRVAGEVPDEVLQERVRAALGRLVRDASQLEVQVENGLVTLSGPVLEREAARLLRKVRRIRGVESVSERLERLERFEPLAGHGAELAAAP
jgi:hyperosmotically inducible protein